MDLTSIDSTAIPIQNFRSKSIDSTTKKRKLWITLKKDGIKFSKKDSVVIDDQMTPEQNYASWFNEDLNANNRTEISTPLEVFHPDDDWNPAASPDTADSVNIMQALWDAKRQIRDLKQQLFNQSRASLMEKPCSIC